MKPSKKNSERIQKWGLFCLLTGSLGFSLSMNPDHFNQTARYQQGSESLDLATQAEVRAADNKIDEDNKKVVNLREPTPSSESASAQERNSKKTQTLIITGKNGGLYKAHLSQAEKDSKAEARLEALEGSVCVACDATILLNSSIDDIKAINGELSSLIERKTRTEEETEKKTVVQKKGEATEVDLDEWAEKCEKASDEISCHKGRLVELSKYLKNVTDNEKYVTDYFKKHLESSIKTGLFSRTLIETSAETCEGAAIYMTRTNRVGCATADKLETASEMVEEIISGLRTQNGREVAKILMKLRAGSFSAQLRNSQAIAKEAQAEGNLTKFNFVQSLGAFNPDAQFMMLDQANLDMAAAINSMDGTNGQRSVLESTLNGQFYSPVSNMLTQMRTYLLTGDPNNPAATHTALDFIVPSLGGESMVAGAGSYTSGMPGNIPNAVYVGRSQSALRGTNLAPLPLSTNSMQSISTVIPGWLQNSNSLLNINQAPGWSVQTRPANAFMPGSTSMPGSVNVPGTPVYSPALIQGRQSFRQ